MFVVLKINYREIKYKVEKYKKAKYKIIIYSESHRILLFKYFRLFLDVNNDQQNRK